jgi:hypothetical protein
MFQVANGFILAWQVALLAGLISHDECHYCLVHGASGNGPSAAPQISAHFNSYAGAHGYVGKKTASAGRPAFAA